MNVQINNTIINTTALCHPALPASYPHLRIDHAIIIRQLQSNLREAATRPDYHKYLVPSIIGITTTPTIFSGIPFDLPTTAYENPNDTLL